jgi:hypothetical protein
MASSEGLPPYIHIHFLILSRKSNNHNEGAMYSMCREESSSEGADHGLIIYEDTRT